MSDPSEDVEMSEPPTSPSSAVASGAPSSPSATSVAPSSPGLPTSSVAPDSPDPRSALISDSEGEGEELIGDNMARDYRHIAELDRYDAEGIDAADYGPMDEGQRRAAEDAINLRDRKRAKKMGRTDRTPAALRDFDDQQPLRRRRLAERAAAGELDDDEDMDGAINLEDYTGPLKYWLDNDKVKRDIQKRFKQFLVSYAYRGEGSGDGNTYMSDISEMCAENGSSLLINYFHISQATPTLAIWLADCPEKMLKILDETAQDVTNTIYRDYSKIQEEIHVRITGLPIHDELRELRQIHLSGLIQCSGVVTRRTSVYPQLKAVKFDCVKCNHILGPYMTNDDKEVQPGSCPACQSQGPFSLNVEQTIYRNYQKITIQEPPGSVPAGRIPRSKDVILTGDLIDIARPGEEIQVTGVYSNNFDSSLNTRNGFPVFATVIHANHVDKRDTSAAYHITDDDKAQIIAFSKKPNIHQIIINSIAPSIWGHENIKTALSLTLFGGVPTMKDGGKHKTRGDINVLILGDPGTAKSQFLKYIEKTARRAVYATGKGASAVGLTASVHKDPLTREWTLEGGALVLADQGVCMIDEFDKMNDQDRTSIHEAMEQQTISISKAGIVATLQARCSVIAAANPINGRYDSSSTFVENVDLTDPIISRFDVLCVVRDTVDPVQDERLALFVAKSHMRSHPDYKPEPGTDPANFDDGKERMPQSLLKKYIVYAKKRCRPSIDNIDQTKIEKVYAELRKESMREGGIPIGVRHIESIIRMSQARAKLHLREYVDNEDVDCAIGVLCDWFINTQKFSVMRSMKKHFKKYMAYAKDDYELLYHLLCEMIKETVKFYSIRGDGDVTSVEIEQNDFEAKAKQTGISDVTKFYKSRQFSSLFSLDPEKKTIRKNL